MSTNYPLLTPAIIALLAASCGGGSDSSGGTAVAAPTFTAQAPITITADRSDEVVTEAISATSGSGFDSAFRSTGGNIVPSIDLPRLLNRFRSIPQKNRSLKTANRTEPANCDNNGTGTVTVSDDLTNISATFSNCLLLGDTLNGSLSLVSSTASATTSSTFSFSNFSQVGPKYSLTLNGSMSEVMTEFSTYDHYVINGSSIVMSISFNGRSLTLGNLNEVGDDYWSAGYETYETSYVANSSTFGGSFSVTTTQTAFENYADSYPYAGQIVISGASGSKVRATSQGSGAANGMVLIETDADGDGAYESSETKTWAELEASLN